MAGVNVEGAKGGRKALDTEINMIPMIDLLMVTISFLLITAVWVHMSRIEGNAQVPGPSTAPPCEGSECKPDARLHVETKDPSKFVLVWKQGATVVRSADVPRDAVKGAKGSVVFPALASRIGDEWRSAGAHRDANDRAFDHAVVHAANDMPYKEIIAVMDAVAATKRPQSQSSAFQITFATD
ncbi:MAG TPA: biopolymer transporter ExbD [Labilithrix sp.]